MSNRDHLLAAAKVLLWERGYESMSPRAVQQYSGAGQGSFYHHFAGKADLATAALAEVASEKKREAFDLLLRPDKDPLNRIIAYLNLHRDALRGCPMGRMVYEPALMEDQHLREPVASYFAYVKQGLTTAIQAAQQNGALNSDLNAQALAATLLSVVQGGYLVARALREPQQLEQATRGAVDMLLAIAQPSKRQHSE